MNESTKLNKLSPELVSQIAAGEVIERPSSIVKELVDNSIDAQATKIVIRVVNGGIDLIEVSDNGVGIPQENLTEIFKPHTTSKLSSLEDLNNLLTMGFRGEALSTIVSIANVKLISKYAPEQVANEITFTKTNKPAIKKAARESGSSISVQNIFYNIPARKKFLKAAATEYRKILDILFPYFLIYPNIHFVLEKDSKQVYDLPIIQNSNPSEIIKERVELLLKEEFITRMLKLFYDGAGIKISGLVAHPSDHMSRGKHQYIFVNRRPIWDSGIARAVYQGYERYMPHGQKIPFIINIEINPELVDVNVHPRKEEVRFLNPFRVYTAVEEAVKKSLVSVTTYKAENVKEYIPTNTQNKTYQDYSKRDITFNKGNSGSVKDSLLFSKELLSQEDGYIKPMFEPVEEQALHNDTEEPSQPRNIYQIFNKYIIIEFPNNQLWIIDQHAAAERITFEKLRDNKENIDTQNMLVPIEIRLSPSELEFVKELEDTFKDFGFILEYKKDGISLKSVPIEFVHADFNKLFDEVLALSLEKRDIKKEFNRLKEDILATMACHGSVRSGQYLHKEEMLDLYNKLIECKNPYSCPHGRPAVWKLSIEQIDSNFERTY
jgi:DNA mismatch repair protein MutL